MLRASLFLLVLGTLVLGGFIYRIEPGPEGRIGYITTQGKLLLHRYSLVDRLSTEEAERLYQNSCTGSCHGADVVEKKPRTAGEWDWIVARMKVAERADLTEPEAKAIIEYLQKYYLSNVPTTLSEETMRFLKKHLWRMDFSESRLALDVIFIPRVHRSLMPYLAFKSTPRDSDDSLFIIYLNVHTGVIPPWNLADMAVLKDGRGGEMKALDWEVLYEDGQKHHRQGILTFPRLRQESGEPGGTLEMTIQPPGMRKRVFRWSLPIPPVGALPVATQTPGSD